MQNFAGPGAYFQICLVSFSPGAFDWKFRGKQKLFRFVSFRFVSFRFVSFLVRLPYYLLLIVLIDGMKNENGRLHDQTLTIYWESRCTSA